ncbi:MAG: hypothetical protein LBD18_05225 [Treponema sp.]|jgi:hypothetical protein|nr:hypothetical protein [Treponema sp.]
MMTVIFAFTLRRLQTAAGLGPIVAYADDEREKAVDKGGSAAVKGNDIFAVEKRNGL